ncbi:hypothetical protein BDV97DRAFT_108829 [Delphinella strobiligena]|nr:hypothetical protein BDV97DRAFT_108829 [Delphinella strobiligena]
MFEFLQFFVSQGLECDSIDFDWSLHGLADPDHPVLHDLYRLILQYHSEPTILHWLHCPGHPYFIRDIAARLDPPLHTYTLNHRLGLILDSYGIYQIRTRHMTCAFLTRLGCQITDDNFLRIIFSDDPSFLCRIVSIFGTAFALGDQKARERLIDLFRAATEARLTHCMYHTRFRGVLMHRFVKGHCETGAYDQRRAQSPETVPTNSSRTWENSILWRNMVRFERHITSSMQSWLDCLSLAGVRLSE